MRYNLLLKFLRFLVSVKRFFWWMGKGVFFVLASGFDKVYGFLGWMGYKINQFFKKMGFSIGGGSLARQIIQPAIFILFFLLALPQTKVFAQKTVSLPGQNTLAFSLFSDNLDYSLEEVQAPEVVVDTQSPVFNWRAGVIGADNLATTEQVVFDQDLAGTYAGGMTINNPYLMTGSVSKSGSGRRGATEYVVETGDSLNGIANKFGVNVATILWQNGLTTKSKLKLGQKLIIPPAVGVMHTVKKGDNLLKIAKLYSAKVEDIIRFNNLDESGKDLRIGETIMVPGGAKPQAVAPTKVAIKLPAGVTQKNGKYYKNGKAYIIDQESYGEIITPPSSNKAPSASGFVWPSGAHTITQYFGWKHHGLDIAGKFETPNYAAKAGTVEFAQCGWNRGYGCYVQIDHGNGVKTLYGHNARLLVSPGEYVETGQTIALMGNTGNVRGITGIHLHFEVLVNGMNRVNPLGYVR